MFNCQPLSSPIAAGAKVFAVLLVMAALPALTLGQISVRLQADPAKPGASANKSADEKLIKEIEARIAELNKQLQDSKARKQAVDAPKKASPPAKVQGWIIELNEKNLDVQPAQPSPSPRIKMKVSPQSAWGELFRGGPIRIQVGGQDKQPPYKVIGPDGKEIKGAKVVPIAPGAETKPANPAQPKLEDVRKRLEMILKGVSGREMKRAEAAKKPEPKKSGILVFDGSFDLQLESAPTGHVIPLSRATYNLPKEKAEALAAFLKANVKTSVLELKVEEHGLTITTAPETQVAIGNFVKLLQGPRAHTFQLHFGPPDKK